jgi:hypothetical protein
MIASRPVVLLALLTSACGGSLMKLPGGPGSPAPDAAAALLQATEACHTVKSITVEIGVSGSVGGRRTRGRLIAGLAEPASARLEAPAPFGQPLFIFTALGTESTLLLPRARRVLEHGRADAVLEAVTGVSLTPPELRRTLTGCAEAAGDADGRSLGDGWLMIAGPPRLYLRRARPADPWRLVAAVQEDAAGTGWRADYGNFVDRLPAAIRLTSADGRRFNLRLVLSQVETNVTLGDDAFAVQIPSGFEPISLEELRQSGPLAEAAAGSHDR